MAATAVLFNPQAPAFEMPGSAGFSFNPDAPEFTSVESSSSSLTLRPDAAEFIPMAGGWATLQAAAEAYQNKQKRAMPFATDEEWEQRIAKREKEVETIKSLQSYRLYIEVFPHDKRGDDDPKTPDPRDRTVSKRMWKWNVEKWRLQLKSRCVYSRSVLLQCREELRRRDERNRETEQSAAVLARSPEPLAEAAPAAEEKQQENETVTTANAGNAESQKERFLKTISIPEPSRSKGNKIPM